MASALFGYLTFLIDDFFKKEREVANIKKIKYDTRNVYETRCWLSLYEVESRRVLQAQSQTEETSFQN